MTLESVLLQNLEYQYLSSNVAVLVDPAVTSDWEDSAAHLVVDKMSIGFLVNF